MHQSLPLWVRFSFLGVVGLVAGLLARGFQEAAARAGNSPAMVRTISLRASLVLFAWLLVTAAAALSGRLLDFTSMPPKLMLVIVPALVAAVAIPASGRLDALLRATPLAWPAAFQSFRIVVEIVLWGTYKNGQIARMMTFEGSNFDIVTGLTAPLVAWYCLRAGRERRGLAVAWNFLGLALLLNVVARGMLSAPTPFQVFHTDPPNTLVARFPYVWLPSFLVAVALFLHVVSLRQLAIRAQGPAERK